MHEITALELGLVIKELRQKVVGSYLKKFYDLGNGAFRFSFHGGEGNFVLYCNPLTTINETDFVEESGAATNFAIAMRKRIEDSKVIDFYQHESDRIAVMVLQGKGAKHRMIIEMFGKGNLILVDENDSIELCHKVASYRDRDVRPRSKYFFPKSGSVELEKLDADGINKILKAVSESDGKVIVELSRYLNVGPLYLEDLITAAGMSPKERLGEDKISALRTSIISFLEKVRIPSPGIYMKGGAMIDYSLFPIAKYSDAEREECASISEMLDRANVSERTVIKEEETNRTDEIDKVIEQQKALVKGFEEDSAKYSETARRVFARMNEINALVSKIREKKKPELEELKGEFPDLSRPQVQGVALHVSGGEAEGVGPRNPDEEDEEKENEGERSHVESWTIKN